MVGMKMDQVIYESGQSKENGIKAKSQTAGMVCRNVCACWVSKGGRGYKIVGKVNYPKNGKEGLNLLMWGKFCRFIKWNEFYLGWI